MALQVIITNDPNDNNPELLIRGGADNAEKFILQQILNGFYGRPIVMGGKTIDGLAKELKIGFKPDVSPEINFLPAVSADMEWDGSDTRSVTLAQIYPWEGHNGPGEEIEVGYRTLRLKINGFENIKDFNPKLIVEKYRPRKDYATKHVNRPSGFVPIKQMAPIPIISSTQDIDINPQFLFRVSFNQSYRNNQYGVKASGYKARKRIDKLLVNGCYVRYRFLLSKDGVEFTTPPLLTMYFFNNGDFGINYKIM